ncbi:unnamed protein product [marine sediment metagenome]|uniref:Uncharacterized protein n=1 Tax=marine sediment metagenome TaxID=412755 RepID=X1S3T9_9ZZZZ
MQPLLSSEIKTISLAKLVEDKHGRHPPPYASRAFLSILTDPPPFRSASLRSDGGAGQKKKSVGNGGTLSTWLFSTAV